MTELQIAAMTLQNWKQITKRINLKSKSKLEFTKKLNSDKTNILLENLFYLANHYSSTSYSGHGIVSALDKIQTDICNLADFYSDVSSTIQTRESALLVFFFELFAEKISDVEIGRADKSFVHSDLLKFYKNGEYPEFLKEALMTVPRNNKLNDNGDYGYKTLNSDISLLA